MNELQIKAKFVSSANAQGLFGNNGILPARIQIESANTVASMHQKPSLLHLARYVGLDTEYMMDALALLGIGIAFTG